LLFGLSKGQRQAYESYQIELKAADFGNRAARPLTNLNRVISYRDGIIPQTCHEGLATCSL
jgi:hypothetical protein